MKRYKQKPKAEAIKNLLQVYSFIGDTARQEQEQRAAPTQPETPPEKQRQPAKNNSNGQI